MESEKFSIIPTQLTLFLYTNLGTKLALLRSTVLIFILFFSGFRTARSSTPSHWDKWLYRPLCPSCLPQLREEHTADPPPGSMAGTGLVGSSCASAATGKCLSYHRRIRAIEGNAKFLRLQNDFVAAVYYICLRPLVFCLGDGRAIL